MSVAQLPYRRVSFTGDGLPTFPASVSITAELGPKELFGCAPLTGRSPLQASGEPLTLSADKTHGGITYKTGAKLPHLRHSSELFDVPIEFDGQNATVNTVLSNEESFRRCVSTMADKLPDFIALALGAPVELVDLFGVVDSRSFTVEIRGEYIGAFSILPVGDAIDAQLRDLKLLPSEAGQRVFAALRYFNQERWLAYSASRPTRFGAERLLNIAKACEVLFPGKVTGFREALAKLKVPSTVTNVLVSAIYVRNQVDVGHIRLSRLSAKELRDFQRLVVEASAALEWLIRYAIREAGAERFILAESSGEQDTRAMRDVAKVLDSLDDEHYRTVLDKSWTKPRP